MKINKRAHIRSRITNLLCLVLAYEDTNSSNFIEKLDEAAARHTDKDERKELNYRRNLIAGFGRKQYHLFKSILLASKQDPISLSDLVQASHNALKQGSGITWTGVSETIAAATGHPLMYSPELMLHDKEAQGLDDIPEYKTETACKKAWPDKTITKHLKGDW